MLQRLEAVEHDEDERARPGHGDDLPAAALAVLGALDDAGKVEQLDLGALVLDAAGHGREGLQEK